MLVTFNRKGLHALLVYIKLMEALIYGATAINESTLILPSIY